MVTDLANDHFSYDSSGRLSFQSIDIIWCPASSWIHSSFTNGATEISWSVKSQEVVGFSCCF